MGATAILVVVETELLAALQAHPAIGVGPSKCVVAEAHPGDQLAREHIWIDREEIDYNIAALRAGRKTRDEKPEIDLGIWVGRSGDSAAKAKRRLLELLGAVEDVTASNPTLSAAAAAAGLNWIVLDRASIFPASGPNGFAYLAAVTLRYQARLT